MAKKSVSRKTAKATAKATKGTSTALPTAVLNRLASDSNAVLAAKGDLNEKTAAPAAASKPAAAAPKGKPAAADKPAAAAPKANPDAFAIHVNKTGRVCFGKDAAARIGAEAAYMTLAIDNGTVRLEPSKKQTEGALPVRSASGRPYVSATKQFKPLGFDGSRPYDIEAKPFGNGGFEFRLQ